MQDKMHWIISSATQTNRAMSWKDRMLLALLIFSTCTATETAADSRISTCIHTNKSVFDFHVATLAGTNTTLNQFSGRLNLIINVATYCAYTMQYLDFNQLVEKYKTNSKGLNLLLFPCNQFGLQEPGNNDEILNGLKYVRPGNGWIPANDVHVFGKLEVNGANSHPLYKFLKETCPATTDTLGSKENMFWNPITTNDVTWNFEKFLVDALGKPRYRFHPANWDSGVIVDKYIRQLS